MILKFFDECNDSWVYRDLVRTIIASQSQATARQHEGKLLVEDRTGGPITNTSWCFNIAALKDDEAQEPLMLRKITVKTDDGKDFAYLIASDNPRVFLMNDEGKTIERL